MLVMAMTVAVGYSHRAWSVGSEWHPVVVVVGAIAIVALGLLCGLIWLLVAWMFGWRPRNQRSKPGFGGIRDGNRNQTK